LEIGKINSIDINQEVRSSFLDYAMSVIVSRALPDARDGLKPVHRRILYAMYDMGIRANTPTRKSARIVGEVLGKYHPHGDSSVYDAMVRMAQDFSMRYMLVEGQGNFGSVDGDSAAAMRYTEARLSPIAMQLLEDIDKNTVEFEDNFDGSLQEPSLLPARLPNLLLNGGSGIAVGMATNIPPHNLGELCDAIAYLIDRQDDQDNVSLEDLMEFVKGPDFPTGATIMGMEGIKSAYGTGKGRIVMRAVAEIGESPARSDRSRITVTELPYQVNKANLIERIAELVNQGKLSDIADLRDESDQRGVSIVIELKKGTQPRKVLNQLYKHTFLQTTFAVQMLALVDKEPRLLSLKRALQIHIDHRVEVITRRIQFDLDKALKRQHILEGLLIALNHLDEVIETIRRSPDADGARTQLIERFGLTEAQATAILDMQLRRLAALERQKIETEYAEVTAHIAHLRHLLSDKSEILAIIREDVAALKKDFGDARRTKIEAADGELRDEDLVRDENILISITRRGYIKRTPVSAYRKQARGGRGLIGMGTRDEDELEHLFAAGSLNTILLFSDSGKVYAVKAYEIPELDRTAKGTSLMNIVPLQSDEKITAALPVRSFEDAQYLTMITRRGRIKRVAVNEFRNVRSNGLIAVNLDDKDALGWVKLTQGGQDMILVSQQGQGIRFREEDVRAMGRTAIGVYAMRLTDGDELAGADVVIPDGDLLLITEKGVGKRTPLDEYRQQGRYGKGVQVMKLDPKRSGNIVSARVVTRDDEMTCISSNGLILRTAVHNISRQGRYSQGVSVMDLKTDDSVVSVAVIREGYLSQATDEENGALEQEATGNGELPAADDSLE
jgi:DNA gyrase subunit A